MTGRRYARRASVAQDLPARTSALGGLRGGRHVKIRRRLGVSPRPSAAGRASGPDDRDAIDEGHDRSSAAARLTIAVEVVRPLRTLAIRESTSRMDGSFRNATPHIVRTGLNRHADAASLRSGPAGTPSRGSSVKSVDPLAVDGDLELVRVGEPRTCRRSRRHAAQQIDADLVFAVLREGVPDERPPRVPNGRPSTCSYCGERLGNAELLRRRRRQRRAQRRRG